MLRRKIGGYRSVRHMMSITEAIYACQEVRHFTTETVPEASIHALLYAAVQAWEGGAEKQPEKYPACPVFAVIRNAAVLQDLPGLSDFHNAETMIIIYAHSGREDAFLAAQNIRLAAIGMGLNTSLAEMALEALNTDDWRMRLEVPAILTAMVAIVIGYPAPNPGVLPGGINADTVTRRPPDILNWMA